MNKKVVDKKSLNEELKKRKDKAKKGMENTLNEYKQFAMKGNVIDMAIGVVIGSAFTNIVNSIVSTTITPLVSLLTNKVDLSTLFISLSGVHYDTLSDAKAAGAITWDYGLLLNAILNFLIVSFTLFVIVKYLKKATIKKTKEEVKEKEKTTKECPYCLSEIPIKATRCGHCTSELVLDEKDKK